MTSQLHESSSSNSLLSTSSKENESLRFKLRKESVSSDEFFDAYDYLEEEMRSLQNYTTDLEEKNSKSLEKTFSISNSRCKFLLLVLHGGAGCRGNVPTEKLSSTSKQNDVQTLQSTFQSVISRHYRAAANQIAFRVVSCPDDVISDVYDKLHGLSPNYLNQQNPTNSFITSSLLSIFLTKSDQYKESLQKLVKQCNNVYNQFLLSAEGFCFNGQVCIISDTIGSLFGYDLLSNHHKSLDATSDSSTNIPEDSPTFDTPKVFSRSSSAFRRSFGSAVDEDVPRRLKPSTRSLRDFDKSGFDVESREDEDQMTLNFHVTDFFMLGSPLGVVLAMREVDESIESLQKPKCRQIFNIFYSSNPSCSRIEPIIDSRFVKIPSVKVPNYRFFPYGVDQSTYLGDTLVNFTNFLCESKSEDGSSIKNSDFDSNFHLFESEEISRGKQFLLTNQRSANIFQL